MQRIVCLEPKGARIKICLESGQSFMLYKSEVRKFHLSENEYIQQDNYSEIMEVLYKRARERALYILDTAYKTEYQIREKLKNGLYPDEIIDSVVSYLSEYHLIDDLRYSVMYIEYKENSKSRRQIMQDLYGKGVKKQIIDIAFEESEYSDEKSLNSIISQKIKKYNMNDTKDIQKLYRYLLSKGYGYSEVKKALAAYTEIN